jgi:O-antigen/teichoic acid export membrane protein
MAKKISTKTAISLSIVVSYITLFVSVILAIFYTPFVLEKLGDIEYGIRSFATAIIGYLSFLSIGLATSYLRFANIAKKERGEEGEKHINGIFFAFYLAIAAVAAILGAIIILLIGFKVIPLEKYTDAEITNWIIPIMVITVAGTIVEFPGIVLRLILTYKQKFIWINLVALLSTIISPLISIIVLIYGGGSVGITWVALGISLGTVLINGIYVFFGLKAKATFKFDKTDKTMFKQIVLFSIVVFVISTLTQMSQLTDKVVIGFVLGAGATTIYQISTTFNAYIGSVVTSITGVFAPRLTEDAVAGRMDNVQYIYDFVIKVITIILCLVVFGFLACGVEFISAWLPNSYDNSYIEVFWLSLVILACNILIAGQTFSFYIQRALNKNLVPAIIYAVVFVLNVAISIILCFAIGIWGCIIGTVFSYIVEAVGLSFYNSRKVNLKQRAYWFSILLNVFIGFIGVVITGFILGFAPLNIKGLIDLNELNNIFQVLIKGASFVIIFMLIQFIFNYRFIKEFKHVVFNKKVFKLDKNKPLEVLIPTMHCDGEDNVRKLLAYLNVKSDAVIANQTEFDFKYSFDYEGHKIKVIDSSTRGVSKNRNILLENLEASIGLFIDDDCALIDGYQDKIVGFFLKNKIEAMYTNGLISSGKKISNKQTEYVVRFSDVSHAGGPGIVIAKEAIQKYDLSFNELLGTPNEIYSGEDSYFMYQLVKKGVKMYRYSGVIFDIVADLEKSSYFKGFDEQFFASKGAVNKLLHPRLYKLYEIYFAFRLQRKTSKRFDYIYKNMVKGEKYIKNNRIVY